MAQLAIYDMSLVFVNSYVDRWAINIWKLFIHVFIKILSYDDGSAVNMTVLKSACFCLIGCKLAEKKLSEIKAYSASS